MKKWIPLLLLCLNLWGCSSQEGHVPVFTSPVGSPQAAVETVKIPSMEKA